MWPSVSSLLHMCFTKKLQKQTRFTCKALKLKIIFIYMCVLCLVHTLHSFILSGTLYIIGFVDFLLKLKGTSLTTLVMYNRHF